MDKEYLVGASGFVGSNLALEHRFSGMFNSKNIKDAYGGRPDLLVYAGIPGVMFLANQNPEKDREIINQAIHNIEEIAPKRIILISTVQVYSTLKNVNEDTKIDVEFSSKYGANRYAVECWVRENLDNYLIIRLPAIFGQNLKKNFIFDYIHFIPAMLKEDDFLTLTERDPVIRLFYDKQKDGYYYCRKLSVKDTDFLKERFLRLNFNALSFTDSRSKYQFYDLRRLWGHVELAMHNQISTLNITTPPIEVAELYKILTNRSFTNILPGHPFDYDIKSKYAELFGGSDGYLLTRDDELADIKTFLRENGAEVQ